MSTPFKRISCDTKHFWNMPSIGIGTYRMKGIIEHYFVFIYLKNTCELAIKHALQTGYRHINTAESYNNYIDIANGIKLFEQQQKRKFFK